ncbi:MAG TPA: RNA pseudouridine synthase [Bacteriovoracaceae bacterium]|nr:RNA pseudouridine synthase [Bacteriovoracaceae bacterium]
MSFMEICWLYDEPSLKAALQAAASCSGQLLKKYLSTKDLKRPIMAREVSRLPLDLVNHMLINPEYRGPEVRILREDSEVIVLHKPPGIHSHPLRYSDTNTLLNFLAAHRHWQPLRVNADQYDRGLLYRLDEETSGVMVVAKKDETYQLMRQDFSRQMKRKFYWAVVEGDFDKAGDWTHHFTSSGVKGSKQKVSGTAHFGSVPGSLAVKKVQFKEGKSLLLISLQTGLRHQIRAQLAFLGYPILGDELYQGKKSQRVFLHALRYEWVCVEEDPAPELFHLFFDLDGALEVTHDMLRGF